VYRLDAELAIARDRGRDAGEVPEALSIQLLELGHQRIPETSHLWS
jgi:hypothetical protein